MIAIANPARAPLAVANPTKIISLGRYRMVKAA
jgi:hypothetical protein